MPCSFSIEHYKEIIDSARDKGYLIIPVKEYSNQKKVILLRHDIDWSLEYAYELANIEYDLGICSSYYVYLHSDTYNALSPKGMKMISAMDGMGHEIGLHYDSRYFCFDEYDILRDIREKGRNFADQTLFLESHTQHWPAETERTKVLSNTIDPNDLAIKYISDSARNWREGCVCQWLGKEDKLHVNIHPEWWISQGIDRWDAINKMYKSNESTLVRNITDIRNMVSDYEREVINKK